MSEERYWNLVTLAVAPGGEEFASSLLFELGSTGIVTLEEGRDTVRLGAYFSEQSDPEEVLRKVQTEFRRAGCAAALLESAASTIPDQDWMQKWKEGFEPIEIGGRLIVAPSWKRPSNEAERVSIQIDPGMAFGTGTHETTRLCLEAILAYWRGGSLLDVGTGTGILAIAAARLAPGSRVLAIDVDAQAVEVARENVEINGVTDSVELIAAGPGDLAGRAFDVVVANLTAEVIIDLIEDLTGRVDSPGLMILSGILTTLSQPVEQSVARAGLQVVERRSAGEWSMLVASRGER